MNQPQTPDNDVARLRELLNRAIEIAKITTEYIEDSDRRKHYRSEIQQLAPAPEEIQDGATMQEWYGGFSKIESTEPDAIPADLNQPNKENTLSLNDWRELFPEEEIHTGDQVQAKHHDRLHGVWLDVFPYEVGAMPIDHEAFRYRTRRPLPVQDEMPLEKAPDHLHAWMRLQEDINRIVGDQIQKFSDEIQKLKEAR